RRGRAPATAERIVLRELRAVAYPTRGLMLVRAGVALGIVRRESDVHRRAHARRQPTPAASEPLRSAIEDARAHLSRPDLERRAAARTTDRERANLRLTGEAVDQHLGVVVFIDRPQAARAPSCDDHPAH